MSGGESLASRYALFLHLHSFAQAHRKLLANEHHWKEPYAKKMNRQMIHQQLPLKIADTLFTVLSSRV